MSEMLGGNSAYLVYGAYMFHFDGHIFPQTPEKISWSYENRTETIYLANDDYINVQHKTGAYSLSMDLTVTRQDYPFTWRHYDLRSAQEWINFFLQKRETREPIEFVMIRSNEPDNIKFNTHEYLILDDLSVTEDQNKANDIVLSCSFKLHKEQVNQEINADMTRHLTQNRITEGYRQVRGTR